MTGFSLQSLEQLNVLPSFDEWYQARHAGRTFDRDHMGPCDNIIAGMKALSFYLREYATDMARLAAALAKDGK